MKKLDKVEQERADIVARINAKYEKKAEKEPLPEPKVWTAEKIDTADISVKKVIKETQKAKPKQPSLF